MSSHCYYSVVHKSLSVNDSSGFGVRLCAHLVFEATKPTMKQKLNLLLFIPIVYCTSCIFYVLLYSCMFLYLIRCHKFAVKLYPCMSNSYQAEDNLFQNKYFVNLLFIELLHKCFSDEDKMRSRLVIQVVLNPISLIFYRNCLNLERNGKDARCERIQLGEQLIINQYLINC